MKKILIDLNIILDFLNKRNYHEEAAHIIDLCVRGLAAGFVCAHEITTLSYFLLKEHKDKPKVIQAITAIMNMFTIISTDETVLRDALLSKITDYEDAVIEASSIKNNIDFIITRNISDFKHSRVQAYTPEQFLVL